MNKKIRIRLFRNLLAGCLGIICACNTDPNPIDTNCTPVLLSPQSNEIMDNGCYDLAGGISWHFEWNNCPDALKYRIYVKHPSASAAIIDNETTSTFYSFSSVSYTSNLTGWTWKVKAFIGGSWREWSDERTFNLEPVGTDCGG